MLANPARAIEPVTDLMLHDVSAGLPDPADNFETRIPRPGGAVHRDVFASRGWHRQHAPLDPARTDRGGL